ncbi:MAG: sugar ABC transporter substrate-binding protein [Anaerolineae bacterium]|nr:sugar ABC transporter substrate-binding protein [Anaerolineae bacterium]
MNKKFQPTNDQPTGLTRRGFLTGAAGGVSALALGRMLGTGLVPDIAAAAAPRPQATPKDSYKMVFIQIQPHTVSTAWGQGIKEVTDVQGNVTFEVLDGQNKADTQISLMDTAITEAVDVIFLQPIDSVGLAPSIIKAKEAGIPIITLNIDATEPHAAHVEMNHYYGAIEIAKKMGEMMGGKGEVAILNAPPGIVIRDLRTNGFVDGMKANYPDIQIVADQVADWSRKKAQEVLTAILAAKPNITGVYGVNDSMALGAVDVAKSKGTLSKMVIFGNDGEKDALESIEKGELSGTQYTDVWQQGRFAAALAIGMATGGVPAEAFGAQGHLLMPYLIATKDTVATILPHQRW